MEWSIRELRCFATAADVGSLTEAAARLHVSQATVSRGIAALERSLGQRVLRRGRHGCEPTAFGERLLPQARRILGEIARFDALAHEQRGRLVLGYAWAAIGKHTTSLVRGWSGAHPQLELRLVRHPSPTAGLAEGRCDVAITRIAPDPAHFDSAVVGFERRFAVFSADDATWQRRRTLRLREFADRTIVADPRTGTTSRALWAGGPEPSRFIERHDVEEWLNAIAAGQGVGVTAEATAVHHPRSDVVYRPIVDAPRIPVRVVWWRDDPPEGLVELAESVARLYAGG